MANFSFLLKEHELEFLKNQAEIQGVSVGELIRSILFPTRRTGLDKQVYSAIQQIKPLSRTASMQASLLPSTELEVDKTHYVYLNDYKYVFILVDGVLHPFTQGAVGIKEKVAEISIYKSALSRVKVGQTVYISTLKAASKCFSDFYVTKTQATNIEWYLDQKLYIQEEYDDLTAKYIGNYSKLPEQEW